MKDKVYLYLSLIIIIISFFIYNNKIKNDVKTDVNIIEEKSIEKIKIDINDANKSEFIKIPGIGEKLAQSIIKYRDEKGKFVTIEDIKKVKGIKEKKFNSIMEYIYVENKSD